MTAERQERKSAPVSWTRHAAVGLLLALSAVSAGIASPVRAATTEWIVADPHTGIALGGMDPVSFFEGKPQPGRPAFELAHAGVVWLFRNEGNRAAFARDPDVYTPRYGGYDPVAIGRGASAPGSTEIWLIAERRLYLFRETTHRDAFRSDPAGVIDRADRQWPLVQKTLAR